MKEQVWMIGKAVNSNEAQYILRVFQVLARTRKRLNEDIIRRLILFYYGSNSIEWEILLGFAQLISQVYFRRTNLISWLIVFFQRIDLDNWDGKGNVHLRQLMKNNSHLLLKHLLMSLELENIWISS
jgi:hypothetical protein